MLGLMTVKKHREILAAQFAKTLEWKLAADSAEAELAHWRAHGQLRDPKTGQMTKRNG